MININWVEFKEYKQHAIKENNFEMLIDFLRSYYNMSNPTDVYDTLKADGTGRLMLEKRDIVDAEGLENFMFQ